MSKNKLSAFFESIFDIFPDVSFLFREEERMFKPLEFPPIDSIEPIEPIKPIEHMSIQEAWAKDFLNIGGDMRRAINKVMEHEIIRN